jgi:hypothetical protein
MLQKIKSHTHTHTQVEAVCWQKRASGVVQNHISILHFLSYINDSSWEFYVKIMLFPVINCIKICIMAYTNWYQTEKRIRERTAIWIPTFLLFFSFHIKHMLLIQQALPNQDWRQHRSLNWIVNCPWQKSLSNFFSFADFLLLLPKEYHNNTIQTCLKVCWITLFESVFKQQICAWIDTVTFYATQYTNMSFLNCNLF